VDENFLLVFMRHRYNLGKGNMSLLKFPINYKQFHRLNQLLSRVLRSEDECVLLLLSEDVFNVLEGRES